MLRAFAAGFPTFVQQPGPRRIAPIGADNLQRRPRDGMVVVGFAAETGQLPTPGKPICDSNTALIGARAWRCKNFVSAVFVHCAELIAVAIARHHSGGSSL